MLREQKEESKSSPSDHAQVVGSFRELKPPVNRGLCKGCDLIQAPKRCNVVYHQERIGAVMFYTVFQINTIFRKVPHRFLNHPGQKQLPIKAKYNRQVRTKDLCLDYNLWLAATD